MSTPVASSQFLTASSRPVEATFAVAKELERPARFLPLPLPFTELSNNLKTNGRE